MKSASLVLVERRGRVGLITLNRPEALNALNHPLMDELETALDSFEEDRDIRAIVISGSARVFAAGADIKEMDSKSASEMAADPHLSRWDKIGKMEKPVIAAVSGYALGGGFELALACDLIVASETAVFGQPEILIGVIPGAGGTVRLARALGKTLALDLVLTGRRMAAKEALNFGIVSRVVPVESYLDESLKLAVELADRPPLAVKAAKESVRMALDLGLEEALVWERRLFCSLFDTEDQKEGMRAFVEKRKPSFVGR